MDNINNKLTELEITFFKWREINIQKRIEVVNKLADILEKNKIEYAYIATQEMGKIKSQAIKEIEKCARLCKYYAQNAEEFLSPKYITTSAKSSYITYAPLGVVLGIMPWNFPYWQAFRFAVPTIIAGNVILLKHASNVTGCSLAIEAMFSEASEETNLQILRSICLDGSKVHDVIAHPLVHAVSLTGSVNAGRSVASTAGKYLKKTVLELGGSDPSIILSDANLNTTVSICADGRLANAGQSCVSPKRFIVVQDVYDVFLKLLTEKFALIKIGDPNLEDTDLGPLANQQIFDTVIEQIRQTIQQGANCHFGGKRISNVGYYIEPTILTNIPLNSPAYTDEIFGPVACIFKVADEHEAIALANDTSFGLGASIFTQNIERAAKLAESHLNAGMVFVNSNVFSDPRLPFGGIKDSGYGRELSESGIHEFVNIKTISIN